MAGAWRPIGATTRRALCRILGSADSLPDRSKASKVLTTVACRVQLFVFELERARYEQAELGVEQLLDRLHQHCQLLGVATIQGGGVQSGYALLSELSALLQELEASIMLLPGHIGSEARYKPALDELQALLANVSHYRIECEDTRRHLEVALSELVHGFTTPITSTGAAPPFSQVHDTAQAPADTHPSLVAQPGSESSGSDGSACLRGGGGAACHDAAMTSSGGAAAGDLPVLQHVRQMICALDLDVDMAERDQDLDAELLQLQEQMQQALQQQQQEVEEDEGRRQQQQQQLALIELDPLSYEVRQGVRRRREAAATIVANAAAPSASGSWCALSPASSSTSTGLAAAPLGSGGGCGSRASRLHAVARHVSRRLAAQHLARLKEYQRQLGLERAAAAAAAAIGEAAADGGGDSDPQPASRRRRLQIELGAATGADTPAAAAPALTAIGKELRSPGVRAGAATVEPFHESLGRGLDQDQECPVAEGPHPQADGSALVPAASASGYSSATRADPRLGPAADAGDVLLYSNAGPGTVAAEAAAAVEAAASASRALGGASVAPGQAGPRPAGQALAARPSGGGGSGEAAHGAEAASSPGDLPGSPQRRPTEASVLGLRKLNRVTQLAGMWEAGRPVAQQRAGEDGAGEGGSLSDCDELSVSCGRSNGGESDAGGELPARPAPRRQGEVVAATAPPPPQQPLPPLPALPDLPGRPGRVAASSPFFMLAMQGRAPKAPPPPVLGRLLVPPSETEPLLEEAPAPPAAPRGGSGGGGGNNSPMSSPTAAAAAAAAGAPGGQRLRGAAAAGMAAPAPLPLPDASVHLRAVGLPGCFAPHWAPPGPFGLPAHAAAVAGVWLAGGVGGVPAAGEGEANGGSGNGGDEQLLDFGSDVPTLDLHRDITGWGPCLGRGAFGAVYKALFRNKPAAVKVLHGGALDVRDMRSLRTEISLLCRLRRHPNIITVYGAAAAPPDHVALVTELMDCDLYDYIHRRRQNCVPLDEVLSIARAIASGLSELHPAIVHRDLKPANVLLRHSAPPAAGQQPQQQPQLDRRLVVKIADFGLARHKRSQYLSTRERDAGTLKYMAPECIASGGGGSGGANGNDGGAEAEGGSAGGGGITEKCDIYSFGVLLYELITGREPWEGCHPLYAMCQVQSGVTLQLPDDPARCPAALRALVLRCWSYQHHQRPSSRELLRELDSIIAARQLQLQQLAAAEGGAEALTEAHASPLWQ